MASIRWLGAGAPAILQALSARGIVRSADAAVTVVHGREWSAVARPAGSWIWLCPGAVSSSDRRAATLEGCYAVVDARASDAAKVLASRVLELSDPGPLPVSGPDVVAESTATRAVLREVAQAART